MFDSRVGRWFAKDPRESKYPSLSTFVSFGNNPLSFVDPKGDTLRVAGNMRIVLGDIKSFVPRQYQNLISISNPKTTTLPDGSVLELLPSFIDFNISAAAVYSSKDAGVIALFEMTRSNNNLLYSVEDTTTLRQRIGDNLVVRNLQNSDGVLASKNNTPRSFGKSGRLLLDYAPLNPGISGQRTLGTGTWSELDNDENIVPKSRESMVFHELYELSMEVDHNQYYNSQYTTSKGVYKGKTVELNSTGSHKLSIDAEKSLPNGDVRKSKRPGEVARYNK